MSDTTDVFGYGKVVICVLNITLIMQKIIQCKISTNNVFESLAIPLMKCFFTRSNRLNLNSPETNFLALYPRYTGAICIC